MEWVSVEDRLPEIEADVLVWHKMGYFAIGQIIKRYDDTREWWWGDSLASLVDDKSTIIYWMPLPSPPI